jgi:phytoene synthase
MTRADSSPSPGSPGEDRSGGDGEIQNPKSKIQNSPLPNPPPEYREREKERASVPASHAYCQHVTRTEARNFYYGLKLLPDEPRRDMFALYAWMRLLDDIADDGDESPTARLTKLDAWQSDTRRALAGEYVQGPLWPAFVDMVNRRRVPHHLFDDAIEGQRQDLQPAPLPNFAALEQYCYRVAGTVGVASIYVWGFEGGQETVKLAIDRGTAFQLTNVLRDLKEDALRRRVYLPQDELTAAGITFDAMRLRQVGPNFEPFMRSQIERAESYYRRSQPLEPRITPSCRKTLSTMTEIYHRLLKKISRDPMAVLQRRVSLSLWSKLWLAWSAS